MHGERNDQLTTEQFLLSPNNCFKLTLQTDGNLVLYNEITHKPIWASITQLKGVVKAVMQDNGNFVLYDNRDLPQWSTNTQINPKSYLAVQNDGNIVIYDQEHHATWASGTVTPCPGSSTDIRSN